MIFFLKQTCHSQTGGRGGGALGKNSHIFPFFYLGSVPKSYLLCKVTLRTFRGGASLYFRLVKKNTLILVQKRNYRILSQYQICKGFLQVDSLGKPIFGGDKLP